MIVTSKIAKIDTTNKMTVAFDVSKQKLNYYSEISGKICGTNSKEVKEVQDEISNATSSITTTIHDPAGLAAEQGFMGLPLGLIMHTENQKLRGRNVSS